MVSVSSSLVLVDGTIMGDVNDGTSCDADHNRTTPTCTTIIGIDDVDDNDDGPAVMDVANADIDEDVTAAPLLVDDDVSDNDGIPPLPVLMFVDDEVDDVAGDDHIAVRNTVSGISTCDRTRYDIHPIGIHSAIDGRYNI